MARDDRALERARDHVFMAGCDDSGARMVEAVLPYGLAKLHHAQHALGLPADATFVGSPDCTVTRNERRWKQGFGYGGVYQWSGDFAVLDIKTNACGMLVGALPAAPELDAVRARLRALDDAGLELDGVPLDNDLTESNHFVDLLEVDAAASAEPAPGGARHLFVMHSSGHEHRGPSRLGPGLYFDESDALARMARCLTTPWGEVRILEGDAARTYHAFYRAVQDFNHRRREVLAGFLFGGFTPLINATHQGLVRGLNQANMGVYHYDDPTGAGPLFPLTLSPTEPVYLVRGKKNLSDAAVTRLGWDDRLDRLGLRQRIQTTNLLPHGGGYVFDGVRGVARVLEDGPDARRFELEPSAVGAEPRVITTPRELPYRYRGGEVLTRLEELDLGHAAVKLDIRAVVTTR